MSRLASAGGFARPVVPLLLILTLPTSSEAGLLGHWRLDDATGDDASQQSFDGRFAGSKAVRAVPGKVGGAGRFGGSTWIELHDHARALGALGLSGTADPRCFPAPPAFPAATSARALRRGTGRIRRDSHHRRVSLAGRRRGRPCDRFERAGRRDPPAWQELPRYTALRRGHRRARPARPTGRHRRLHGCRNRDAACASVCRACVRERFDGERM